MMVKLGECIFWLKMMTSEKNITLFRIESVLILKKNSTANLSIITFFGKTNKILWWWSYRIRTFYPRNIFGLRGIRIFVHKKSKHNCWNSQDFELYQVFMYNFLSQNVPIFSIYILFTKRFETFWSRGISSIRCIRTFWTISSFYI